MYKSPKFRLIPSLEVERVMTWLKTVDLSEPLSPAERAAFESSKAAEMARAIARRQPSPQLELEGGQ